MIDAKILKEYKQHKDGWKLRKLATFAQKVKISGGLKWYIEIQVEKIS